MAQTGDAAARLAALDCRRLTPGLTDAEFALVEASYGFTFADDHREFLAAGLPVDDEPGRGWPDWRSGDPAELRRMLDWPVEGVLFDVEHNGSRHEGPLPDVQRQYWSLDLGGRTQS